jgi:hypothetical protein
MSDTATTTQTRVRSPGFPFIGLKKALAKAKDFYKHEKRNWASVQVAANHWGFNPKSSSGKQTVAALIAYGLMESKGAKENRMVRLSDSALRIILDEREASPDRDREIREAAVRPKLHGELWEKYGSEFPSDVNLRHYLILDHEPPFNENWVDHFIGEFKATLGFSGLLESDNMSSDEDDTEADQGEAVRPVVTPSAQPKHSTPPAAPAVPGAVLHVPVFLKSEGRIVLVKVDYGEPITLELLTGLRRSLASLEKTGEDSE